MRGIQPVDLTGRHPPATQFRRTDFSDAETAPAAGVIPKLPVQSREQPRLHFVLLAQLMPLVAFQT